jgi:cytochrome d ubiquinol oxidase subunit I
VAWLRGRRDHYQRLAFAVPFAVAALMTPVQLVTGDLSSRAVATDQPTKYAAIEAVWVTQGHNPEDIGGFMDSSGQVHLDLPIPSLNSFLLGYSPNTVVRGLSSFPADSRPSVVEVNITHLAFDAMVGLGFAGFALALWFAVTLLRTRALPRSRWFYRVAALAGPGAYLAVELGWITTEVGRQPWIVYFVMRVRDAVTSAPASFVWTMLATLVVVYALIAFFFITVLRRLAMRWKTEDVSEPAPEVGMPYGPRATSYEG